MDDLSETEILKAFTVEVLNFISPFVLLMFSLKFPYLNVYIFIHVIDSYWLLLIRTGLAPLLLSNQPAGLFILLFYLKHSIS